MACLQPCALPFVLDGRVWEGVGAVPVTIYGGERWEGVVGGIGQAGSVVMDGGGELAVMCHSAVMMVSI